MDTTSDDRFRIISSNTEVVYVNGLTTALRILIPVVLVGALTVGAVEWVRSGFDGAPGSDTGADKPAVQAPPPSEYFPAQYVNQATEVEPHIEAF